MSSWRDRLHRIVEQIYYYLHDLEFPQAARWQRYGLVFLLITLFYLLNTSLFVTLHQDAPFLFSLFIVILSAWYGGFGPGLLATFFSTILASNVLLDGEFSILKFDDFATIIFTLAFLVEGVFISMLIESRRRTDRAKSEFIGIISHELKNPLTSVKGYIELILRRAKQKKDRKITTYASTINMRVNQVVTMVNDLLDASKIEAGRLTFQDESFDLSGLIKEVISDQQILSQSHRILLTGNAKRVILADRYRIGQVLTNLVTNAIKYSPDSNKIKVKVLKQKNSVVISVKDYGIGLSKHEYDKLFLPFYRAGNPQKTQGSGIGLYICSEIARRHKGRIWVESKINKGSTFYLQLPVK